jgi:predicted branched-subunit amino acid permease
MSSYLSRFINVNTFKKLIIAFGITDETFAIGSKNPNASYQLKLNFIAYSSWIFGTALGLFFGYLIPKNLVNVLPFALIALFIFILVDGIKCSKDVLIAIIAGSVSALLSFMQGWNILVAALIACSVGWIMEEKKWTKLL